MKKHLKAITVAAVTIAIVVSMTIVFPACTRKTLVKGDSNEVIIDTDIRQTSSGTEASVNSDFNIFGEWRYVITRGGFGDAYAEEWLSSSVLRIFENHDNGFGGKVEFVRGENVYYGDLKFIDNHVYRFSYLSVSEYGEYEMVDTLTFDPATGRIGQEDGESMMSIAYYEWAGPAGAIPQAAFAQRNNRNSRLYGTWENENKLNNLMFLEPNIFYEEGGTTVVGGRNTFVYSFDGKTLTISENNNEPSYAPVTINGDILTIGPFEGGHDWHYNIFLWGTFRKTQ